MLNKPVSCKQTQVQASKRTYTAVRMQSTSFAVEIGSLLFKFLTKLHTLNFCVPWTVFSCNEKKWFFVLQEGEVKRFDHAGKFLMVLGYQDKKEPIGKKRNLIQGVT